MLFLKDNSIQKAFVSEKKEKWFLSFQFSWNWKIFFGNTLILFWLVVFGFPILGLFLFDMPSVFQIVNSPEYGALLYQEYFISAKDFNLWYFIGFASIILPKLGLLLIIQAENKKEKDRRFF